MRHFGTDGIRAIADVFTEDYLRRIVLAAMEVNPKAKFIIARDTRKSGLDIERTLSQTISACGNKAVVLAITSTPTLAFLTKELKGDFGIMISASHNPPEYNGIKFFSSTGEKISDEIEQKIDSLIDNSFEEKKTQHEQIDYYYGDDDYINYLIKTLTPDIKGMKVCLDCANGATATIAPMLFAKLKADVTAFNVNTDGKDINMGCGATHPEYLVQKMKEKDYDIGFSYDGDGDRLMCVQNGRIFNGDHLMYVHAKVMKEKGILNNNTVIGTVMSNMGTQRAFERNGIRLLRTAVGDKHVYREMKNNGYNLGAEECGHIIFSNYMKTGDGVLASLLTAMLARDYDLSTLDDIKEYPKAIESYMCDKETMERCRDDKEIQEYLRELKFEGRTVVRPSGTEPKIRILVEAADREAAENKAKEIKEFLRRRLG